MVFVTGIYVLCTTLRTHSQVILLLSLHIYTMSLPQTFNAHIKIVAGTLVSFGINLEGVSCELTPPYRQQLVQDVRLLRKDYERRRSFSRVSGQQL